MAKYICNQRVGCDGRTYEPEEEILVRGEQAEALLKSGAIRKRGKLSAFARLFGDRDALRVTVVTEEGEDR